MAEFDSFTPSIFLSVLEPIDVLLVILLGLSVGFFMSRSGRAFAPWALYWQVAAGVIFFAPLALLRNLTGSDVWERNLGLGVLWTIYLLARFLGSKLRKE